MARFYFALCGVFLLVASAHGSEYKKDQCEEPLDTGPCRARIPSWGYDIELEQCVQFIYGGCKGNPNNFLTEGECIDMCEHPRSCYNEDDDTWYYDQESKDGGAGCGGCTCNDGLFQCSSCNQAPLVCKNLRCDVECDYGYKSDEDGCDTCTCRPQPGHLQERLDFYCGEVCKYCSSNYKIKCPDECKCFPQ